MKRIISSFFVVLVLCVSICSFSVSAENNVTDIAIDVAVQENGDAVVTQAWKGYFDEGTEVYLPIGNLASGMDITDFSAWDKNGQFEYLDDWDVDASFEEKAQKCGVVTTDSGYELCFGIGQYGENNEYGFSYTIKGLVGAFDDQDGFNFQFVNTQMNIYPTNVDIVIRSENSKIKFNDENCDIYAFGYEGRIDFEDNQIHAYTTSAIDSGENYVNIVTGFKKGVLSPVRNGEQDSFEALVDTAKEGSSYGSREDDEEDMTIFIAVACLVALGAIVTFIMHLVRKIQISNFVKKADYFRDTPCGDDMDMAFCLARDFSQTNSESTIIGACILELINNHNLEPMIDKETGFMGKEKKHVNLRLANMPSAHERASTRLYNILSLACGDDGILQEKELKKYCTNQPEVLRNFIDGCKAQGEMKLGVNGIYTKRLNKMSEFTKKNLSEVVGLKKYLLDFSLISERGVEESAIWDKYLTYAALLGIADKVMDEFKKVYPDNIEQIRYYENNLYYMGFYYHLSYDSMHRAEMARNEGSGGSASFGGGGGFSGGGMGGGTR